MERKLEKYNELKQQLITSLGKDQGQPTMVNKKNRKYKYIF